MEEVPEEGLAVPDEAEEAYYENFIPEEYLDLFDQETVAHVATVMPDGTPHVVPVWVDYDGEYVLIAGWEGHQRHRNIEETPKVSLSIVDRNNVYRALIIRGDVVETTHEGAMEMLDEQARRYWNVDKYPFERTKPRLLVKIAPTHVVTHPGETPDSYQSQSP
jgi:PPOX class probable F420-dependent enzyme